MARRASGRRYAQAVFQIALEKQEPDLWLADLVKISKLGEDAALVAVLGNPKVRFDDKTRLLSAELAGVNPLALSLVYLLVARNRFGLVGDIAAEYQELLDSHRGIEAAEVVTAVPLDEEDRAGLVRRLEAMVGKKVTLKTSVDTGLLGGVVARVGGKLFDGSTRTRLEALKGVLGSAKR
ncbi:MAG: ATP synthase F1 subunit delta [Chloroflexi bacterium]|nr:ATP synthase F1 subunit delta [Chloroflexota bacterium]